MPASSIPLSAIRQPAFLYDAGGRVVEANDLLESLAGRPLAGCSVADVQAVFGMRPPGGPTCPLAELPVSRALRGEEAVDVSLEVTASDGRILHVLATASPVRDGDAVTGAFVLWQDVTGQTRAEEALRRSEGEYRHLVEYAPTGIYEIEYAGPRFRRVNDAMCRSLGYTREELMAMSPAELLDEESRQRFGERVQKVLAGEPVDRSVSFHVLGRDGREYWAALEIKPTFTDGRMDGALVVAHDVTERKRAEEAVRRSEARLVEAQRLAKVGDWEWDLATGDVVWSRETSAIFGRDPDVPAPGFRDEQPRYYAPESWARLTGAVQRALEAGEPYDLEVEVVREDGAHCWLIAKGEAVRDAAGAVTKLRGTVHDITEQRRAARQLERNEALLARVLELSMDGIYRRDMATGRYEYANPALASITGYSLEELGGMDLDAVIESVHPDDRAFVQEVSETSGSWSGTAEYRYRCRDGAYRWISEHFTVETDDDRPRFITGVVRDVTSRRENEEAMREYAENLRRSNEDLERFAYVSSHDLQEPLRSIVSFSQLLERRYKGKLDQDADDYIAFIVEGGNRMQALILDLLAYSRITMSGSDPHPVDAEDVVAAVERHLDLQLREARAVLTHDPMPTVLADPLQVEQVLANLISNAIKFRRPEEPLRIHVGAQRTDGFWEFSVRDNGIGIAPEYLDQIFVIFQRLHTKEAYPGTGIGLAIVKRIVDRHGGTVRVESVPGEGSTFFFTLPAA